MIETAEIKTTLSSKTLLEKAGINPSSLPGLIFIEDLANKITACEKLKAFIKAMLWPRKMLANVPRHFDSDQTAVILFSSGSSGRPKGVELSHHNIQSNLESALMVFRARKDDKLCAILPFFHSFGLSCTLWLPLIAGVSVCYIPNPLDGKLVGQTVKKEKATLFFATPTFLLNYLRRCDKDDFRTMRFIIAGAESLKSRLADAFEEKFGIRPRQGYGATECSPLIAINVMDAEIDGVRQIGTKDNTAGHTLPGLAVKVLDVQTGEPVEIGEQGILYIKGPNVMKGYLKMPEQTAKALKDGWYNTGDVVTIDEDGFVAICGRLSRFSKIGGEMVPHEVIEDTCLKGFATDELLISVTGVPDEKKGEQIVLLYNRQKADADKLFEILSTSQLPKLYIPKRENIIAVDEIPLLGSGKIDMVKINKIAIEIMMNKKLQTD